MIIATQKSKRIFEVVCPVDKGVAIPRWIEPSERDTLKPVLEWLDECGYGYQLVDVGCVVNLWVQKIKFFSDTPATQFKLTWC